MLVKKIVIIKWITCLNGKPPTKLTNLIKINAYNSKQQHSIYHTIYFFFRFSCSRASRFQKNFCTYNISIYYYLCTFSHFLDKCSVDKSYLQLSFFFVVISSYDCTLWIKRSHFFIFLRSLIVSTILCLRKSGFLRSLNNCFVSIFWTVKKNTSAN